MPIFPTRISNVAEYIRRHGLAAAVAEIRDRLADAYWERRLGVRTEGMVTKANLDVSEADSIDYVPMRYRAVFSVLRMLPGDRSNDVFVDFGCGKGRVVVVAATFPFKAVIGVELSRALAAVARDNVERMKRRAARSIEIVCANASEFAIPLDASVLYFFNPFRGETLRQVLSNTRRSIELHPRTVSIVFFNNDLFEDLVDGQPWIRRRFDASSFHGYSCGVYLASPTAGQASAAES